MSKITKFVVVVVVVVVCVIVLSIATSEKETDKPNNSDVIAQEADVKSTPLSTKIDIKETLKK